MGRWGDGEFIKTMRKKVFKDTKLIQNYLFPVPRSAVPCSQIRCSLFPDPLFPDPLFPLKN